MSYYEANLEALRKYRPQLVSLVENDTSEELEVIEAKSGCYTLRSKEKDIFLLSSYDPQKEAEQWVKKSIIKESSLLVIIGFGLGYHIKDILENEIKPQKVLILDPDVEGFHKALKHFDLIWLIKNPKIVLYLGNEKNEITNLLRKTVNPYQIEYAKILQFLPVMRHKSEEFTRLQKHVSDALAGLMLSFNTLMLFSQDWPTNFLLNLPHTVSSPGISVLEGIFEKKPAVIVSAGPSLQKNIHQLKKAKNKALIIAVGPTLRPLLKEGIEPDIVVSLDASIKNYKHFEGIETGYPFLIYDFVIQSQILTQYKGPKIVCCNEMNLLSWVEKHIGENKGSYKTGPSVANMAFGFARFMKADPIIFVGQDLAYTGGLSHAPGTAFSREVSHDKKHLIEVEDIYGNKVLTDRSLYAFLEWFEQEIALTKGATVIDATEGGAKIAGTEIMTLEKTLDTYCSKEYDYHNTLMDVHKTWKMSETTIASMYAGLEEAAAHIDQVKSLSSDGLRYSDELANLYKFALPSKKKLDKVLKKLNRIDKEIKRNKDSVQILSFVFQPVYVELQRRLSRETADKNEKDKSIKIAEGSSFLYSGLKDVAEYISCVLQHTKELFKESFEQVE